MFKRISINHQNLKRQKDGRHQKVFPHIQKEKPVLSRSNLQSLTGYQQNKKFDIYQSNLDVISSDPESDKESTNEKSEDMIQEELLSDPKSLQNEIQNGVMESYCNPTDFICIFIDLLVYSFIVVLSAYGFCIHHFANDLIPSYSSNNNAKSFLSIGSFQPVNEINEQQFLISSIQEPSNTSHSEANNHLKEVPQYDLQVHRVHLFTQTMGIVVNLVVILLIIQKLLNLVTKNIQSNPKILLISIDLLTAFYLVSILIWIYEFFFCLDLNQVQYSSFYYQPVSAVAAFMFMVYKNISKEDGQPDFRYQKLQ